ncbi:DUF2515 domain-containing protein [Virgibacillus halodenitrificans]|uniref:DUF2515 family protein n=1 Tax=Virgibacillus halodenitrificans TaxID=1482 RepID=UPI001FB3BEDB|nr:DUF2515 family protein [Virgibacillus halodenitrificans]MCJ0931041.1 DUF2515 domain-containing protein [Virgibacillus halodenitrificans]
MNLSLQNTNYLHYITKLTRKHNKDNISRTKAYFNYYVAHPEIKWSFLASMVSRNAGYNMTDLWLSPFTNMLNKRERSRMFMTYERANWLIFSDAYPQLLTYELSIYQNKPMFYLLKNFHTSQFMINEWESFWRTKDLNRLVKSLIINEQNVIQAPVIRQSFFRKHVFTSLPYLLQDFLMMNAAVFPGFSGVLYGIYVHDFSNLSKRIRIGKQLASILFEPSIYHQAINFAKKCEHTGSRKDYEQYINVNLPAAPALRTIYPVIEHQDIIRRDWSNWVGIKKKWMEDEKVEIKEIGKPFYRKRAMLYAYYHLKQTMKN